MAPEVLMGSRVIYKSDIFSLGMILHFMLTKTLPDFVDNVKLGKFNISSKYSGNIYRLLTLLLKDNASERPDI